MQVERQIAAVFIQFVSEMHAEDKCPGNQNRATNALCAFTAIRPQFKGNVLS